MNSARNHAPWLTHRHSPSSERNTHEDPEDEGLVEHPYAHHEHKVLAAEKYGGGSKKRKTRVNERELPDVMAGLTKKRKKELAPDSNHHAGPFWIKNLLVRLLVLKNPRGHQSERGSPMEVSFE